MITLQNEYKIDFEPVKHRYTINGQYDVASWTGVLGILDKSAGLLPWAVNCAVKYIQDNGIDSLEKAKTEWRTVKDEACDIGSEVHGIIEKYIKYGRDTIGELRPEVENAFLAFLDWEKTTGVIWHASECRVYNSRVHIAGTFDAIGEIEGKHYLIDFKSSKGHYSEYELQLAGYFSALREYDMPFKVETSGILRLDKVTGLPDWKEYPDVYDKIETVEKLAEVFYMLKKRRLKNNPMVKRYHE